MPLHTPIAGVLALIRRRCFAEVSVWDEIRDGVFPILGR